MINVQTLLQLKAFARIDGLLLALLWTASFAGMMYLPQSMLGSLLMFATPFFLAWRIIRFRNNALDGLISFRRAFAYGCYVFFYASLLFALVQALYFQFLDGARFIQTLNGALQSMEEIYRHDGPDINQAQETVDLMAQMRPVETAFVFMMQNLFIGVLVSPVVAVFCKRKPNSYVQQ